MSKREATRLALLACVPLSACYETDEGCRVADQSGLYPTVYDNETGDCGPRRPESLPLLAATPWNGECSIVEGGHGTEPNCDVHMTVKCGLYETIEFDLDVAPSGGRFVGVAEVERSNPDSEGATGALPACRSSYSVIGER